jgi:hypothetical protein
MSKKDSSEINIVKKNPKIIFDATFFKDGENLSEKLGEWWKDPDKYL